MMFALLLWMHYEFESLRSNHWSGTGQRPLPGSSNQACTGLSIFNSDHHIIEQRISSHQYQKVMVAKATIAYSNSSSSSCLGNKSLGYCLGYCNFLSYFISTKRLESSTHHHPSCNWASTATAELERPEVGRCLSVVNEKKGSVSATIPLSISENRSSAPDLIEVDMMYLLKYIHHNHKNSKVIKTSVKRVIKKKHVKKW